MPVSNGATVLTGAPEPSLPETSSWNPRAPVDEVMRTIQVPAAAEVDVPATPRAPLASTVAVPDGDTTVTEPLAPLGSDVKISVTPNAAAAVVTFTGTSVAPAATTVPPQVVCAGTVGGALSAAPAAASAA